MDSVCSFEFHNLHSRLTACSWTVPLFEFSTAPKDAGIHCGEEKKGATRWTWDHGATFQKVSLETDMNWKSTQQMLFRLLHLTLQAGGMPTHACPMCPQASIQAGSKNGSFCRSKIWEATFYISTLPQGCTLKKWFWSCGQHGVERPDNQNWPTKAPPQCCPCLRQSMHRVPGAIV